MRRKIKLSNIKMRILQPTASQAVNKLCIRVVAFVHSENFFWIWFLIEIYWTWDMFKEINARLKGRSRQAVINRRHANILKHKKSIKYLEMSLSFTILFIHIQIQTYFCDSLLTSSYLIYKRTSLFILLPVLLAALLTNQLVFLTFDQKCKKALKYWSLQESFCEEKTLNCIQLRSFYW
jgi:hypothetical protein